MDQNIILDWFDFEQPDSPDGLSIKVKQKGDRFLLVFGYTFEMYVDAGKLTLDVDKEIFEALYKRMTEPLNENN
jgi:hypothetical protein